MNRRDFAAAAITAGLTSGVLFANDPKGEPARFAFSVEFMPEKPLEPTDPRGAACLSQFPYTETIILAADLREAIDMAEKSHPGRVVQSIGLRAAKVIV